MSRQRSNRSAGARRTKRHPGMPQFPSVHHGLLSLNAIAGNRAMSHLTAELDPVEEEEDDEAAPTEEAESPLQETLGRYVKLMERVEKARGDGAAYRELRAWILELVERLHLALGATEDYEGELEELLEDLGKLPDEPGKKRVELLIDLAAKLHAEADGAKADLAANARDLAGAVRKAVKKARAAADADVAAPELAAAALGGATGGLALRRRRRRKRT